MVETEGLRPFAGRTGIPLGQLRSLVQGRAARSTTLELIASVLELEFYIGPARANSLARPGLPPEIAQALDLPRDASVAEAVRAIDTDAMALKLARGDRHRAGVDGWGGGGGGRPGRGVIPDLVSREHASARVRPEGAVAMIPFAVDVRLAAGTGEAVFEESAEVSIVVATEALASWARPDRLTCVSDSRRFNGVDHPRRRPGRGRRRPGPDRPGGWSSVRVQRACEPTPDSSSSASGRSAAAGC